VPRARLDFVEFGWAVPHLVSGFTPGYSFG
jgi:hypothetical protein